MNNIYFCSDLHFCHDRAFLYEPRGFNSIYEHNETIIKNFNKIMDWSDTIYILGDCFLNNNEEGMKLMRQIPGTKHIIWGNHDTDTRKELMKNEGLAFVCHGYANMLKYGGYHFYLSHYPTLTSNYDEDKRPLQRRVINLCGHSHVQDPFADFNKGLIYHVELDAHNCYPVLLDDIIEDIQSFLNKKNTIQF